MDILPLMALAHDLGACTVCYPTVLYLPHHTSDTQLPFRSSNFTCSTFQHGIHRILAQWHLSKDRELLKPTMVRRRDPCKDGYYLLITPLLQALGYALQLSTQDGIWESSVPSWKAQRRASCLLVSRKITSRCTPSQAVTNCHSLPSGEPPHFYPQFAFQTARVESQRWYMLGLLRFLYCC